MICIKSINKSLFWGGDNMMYPFMTLDDNTEIVHSDVLIDGKVKVYIEKQTQKIAFIV